MAPPGGQSLRGLSQFSKKTFAPQTDRLALGRAGSQNTWMRGRWFEDLVVGRDAVRTGFFRSTGNFRRLFLVWAGRRQASLAPPQISCGGVFGQVPGPRNHGTQGGRFAPAGDLFGFRESRLTDWRVIAREWAQIKTNGDLLLDAEPRVFSRKTQGAASGPGGTAGGVRRASSGIGKKHGGSGGPRWARVGGGTDHRASWKQNVSVRKTTTLAATCVQSGFSENSIGAAGNRRRWPRHVGGRCSGPI